MTMISVPAEITLGDVAAMGQADELHRYELSDEGELRVMMTPTPEHSRIVMRLTAWFLRNGVDEERLRTDLGIYTGGGRQPDLTVWADTAPDAGVASVYVPVDGLQVVIEVVSRGSRQNDLVDKVGEYARAGIERYWTVEQGGTQPVTFRTLGTGGYSSAGPRPLDWVLKRHPADFGLS
ncbi:Uma2 family endonuclease [Frankia sp. CNm7]|uniref:Uma2 family endonuclease n=1 Tax=Frankia nepalensis TaxID=1836974 RepID=A0A937UQS7_9ACTN|nr:Uma2 family endonuclease [Frankia nepalensis]MBL7497411.1 Uma2 family endonuclease [Frankia nepalensis]MBL7512753.1 Uma2 family endonuclease [Frankia nepalensis]MBL7517825.1 Uma2 family endonuclease [Frankia nepalensis]MBL7632144.1 Uma2 family endonuclease [Frankia nepalensis]